MPALHRADMPEDPRGYGYGDPRYQIDRRFADPNPGVYVLKAPYETTDRVAVQAVESRAAVYLLVDYYDDAEYVDSVRDDPEAAKSAGKKQG